MHAHQLPPSMPSADTGRRTLYLITDAQEKCGALTTSLSERDPLVCQPDFSTDFPELRCTLPISTEIRLADAQQFGSDIRS